MSVITKTPPGWEAIGLNSGPLVLVRDDPNGSLLEPSQPHPVYEFLQSQLQPHILRECPILQNLLEIACAIEEVRLNNQNGLDRTLHDGFYQAFTGTRIRSVENPPAPNDARVMLACKLAQSALYLAADLRAVDFEKSQAVRGIGMALIALACHAQYGPPKAETYNQFAMAYLYADGMNGADPPRNWGELKNIAIEQNSLAAVRITEKDCFETGQYQNLSFEERRMTARNLARGMPKDVLERTIMQSMAIVVNGPKNDPSIDSIFAWEFYLAAKDEIFCRDLQEEQNRPSHTCSARASMAARRCSLEAHYDLNVIDPATGERRKFDPRQLAAENGRIRV